MFVSRGECNYFIKKIRVMHANSTPGGDVVKDELSRFVVNWNIQPGQAHVPHQLLCAYLACAIQSAKWELVYEEVDPVVAVSLLVYGGRKAGNAHPENFAKRQREPLLYARLFSGATVVDPAVYENDVWKDFLSTIDDIPLITGAEHDHPYRDDGSEWILILLFHLTASGVPNIGMFVCDGHFVKSTRHRDMLISRLVALREKWRRSPSPALCKSFALCICGCAYPSIEAYEWKDFVPVSKALLAQPPPPSSPQGRDTQLFVVVQPPAWNADTERLFAEEPMYREYKKNRGWPLYYDSRTTIRDFLSDTANPDWWTVDTPNNEVVRLASQLAKHANPRTVTENKQGRTFARVMHRSVSKVVSRNWTSCDMIQRMIIAHHPRWKEVYAYAWSPDLTVENELTQYRKEYPALGTDLVAALFDE